jgi:hypothetical protein
MGEVLEERSTSTENEEPGEDVGGGTEGPPPGGAMKIRRRDRRRLELLACDSGGGGVLSVWRDSVMAKAALAREKQASSSGRHEVMAALTLVREMAVGSSPSVVKTGVVLWRALAAGSSGRHRKSR